MKEKFIEFLKSNNIYDLFIYELARADIKDHGRIYGIEHHLDTTSPVFMFDTAFVFNETDNGFDFWDRYDKIWRVVLEEEMLPMEKDIYDKTITINGDDVERIISYDDWTSGGKMIIKFK